MGASRPTLFDLSMIERQNLLATVGVSVELTRGSHVPLPSTPHPIIVIQLLAFLALVKGRLEVR